MTGHVPTEVAAKPLVSIVIPCFDPGEYLALAVESALAQSHPSIEIIVVDDGSREDVRSLLAPFPGVRYIRQRNAGVSAARNRGARESTGDFLVFLDADDRLLPDAVAVGLQALQARPDAAFAAGVSLLIDAAGARLPFKQAAEVRGDCYEAMLQGNYIWMPAQVLYRRRVFESARGFRSGVDACADYDLYLRIMREQPVALHRQPVAEYRQHGANMSGKKAVMLAAALRTLNREWRHAKKHPAYRRAYWNGRRFWRDWYGGPLVEEIRTGIRSRRTLPVALRDGAVLLRHHPYEALRQLGRKLRALLRTGVPNSR